MFRLKSRVKNRIQNKLTVELCHLGERGILPDNDAVVGVTVGRDQLLVVWCKSQ